MTVHAYTWLVDSAESAGPKTIFVCSSRRLTRELRAAYESEQLRADRQTWHTPQIQYWDDWLAATLDTATSDRLKRLLNVGAATLLWEQCLGKSSREPLLSMTAIVRHARQAWQRMHDWRLTLDTVAAAAASRDEQWFVRAAKAYSESLQAGGWIDDAQLSAYCAAELTPAALAPGMRIVHAGFDRLTPAQQFLLQTLAEKGVEIAAAPQAGKSATTLYRSYVDQSSQWRAAGNWARQMLQSEPSARLAVIAPDLEADGDAISRQVREGFAPGWQLAGPAYRRSVNLSYGKRLTEFPLLVAAEKVLRFAAGGLRGGDISFLLRTPFVSADELPGRSRLELHLRSVPDRIWQPQDLLDLLSAKSQETDGLAWRQRLKCLVELQAEADSQLTPTRWAERFDQVLQAVGWPAVNKPDSDEFQLLNRWRQLLNEFAGLEHILPILNLAEAVRRLFQLAGATLYQPEAASGGLSLMGLLEASGMEFDYLWVGGMDSTRWPTSSQPLALLNRDLQRAAEMPDATPGDTLEFALRTLARLRHSAAELVFCWARGDGDTELLPSPLLGLDADSNVIADSDDPGLHASNWTGSASCALLQPDNAPPVQSDEQVRGGAYTVQKMREEPFTAFVTGRLAVSELEPFRPGLSPRQRGIVLHDALQQLLIDKPTRSELAAWQAEDREVRIEKSAWRSLRHFTAHADDVLRQVLQLEKQRLQQLLQCFLDAEVDRAEFRIESLEQQLELQVGTVRLTLRIDRVDRLADDSLLIADYKSGSRKAFMNRKINAPANIQLSVYARASNESIGGLALIYLDSREIRYEGEGGSIDFGRIKPDEWHESLRRWCAEVDGLLVRFAAGETGVNQAQSADDARPLALLSRIEELRRDR